MQYTSLNATMIVPRDAANRLALEAAFDNWAEENKPASILHARFYRGINAHDWGIQGAYVEPIEEYFAVDQKEPRWTGWKLVTVWSGAIAGSWALVIGCVVIARALLP